MTSAERIKRQIDQAMEHREARVAVLIGDNIRNALDMLDEQPTAVIEALIEHSKALQLSGNAPKHRHDLRAALIEYLEQRLHEATARERRLARAITGAEDFSDDYKPGMS
jgi:hypothetical protein